MRIIRQRVPQPPVQPLARDAEHHSFWPGFVLGLIALALVISGVQHVTSVEASDGGAARELQLVKSFTSGGLQVVDAVKPPDPAAFSDPQALAAAMDRMAREEGGEARIKYRVNIGARDPCPT